MKKTNMLRIILVILTIILSGCATALVTSMKDTQTEEKISSDSIIAIGTVKLKGEDANATDNSLFALVGLKYTYVIDKTEGEEFSDIAQLLDGEYLQVNNGEAIRLRIVDWDEKKAQPTKLEAHLQLEYMKAPAQLSAKELSALEKMGFQLGNSKHDYYVKTITIDAKLYPVANNLNEIKQTFKKQRNVEIYKYGSKSATPAKVVLTPFAVVFDVVTSPIQIPLAIWIVSAMKKL